MKPSKICHYCGGKVIFTSSSAIYENGQDMIYLCTNCNAYVGVHKGTDKPLGKLANAVLRMKRRETHIVFDAYWKDNKMSRTQGYKWLSKQLGYPVERTHIGHFDMETCETVIELCHKNSGYKAA